MYCTRERENKMNVDNPFEELAFKAGVTTAKYIEMMAAAYLQETGLKPSEVELVMQTQDMKTRWYFQRRAEVNNEKKAI